MWRGERGNIPFRAGRFFDLPYSLPFLCQIGPELCKRYIILNPYLCATNVCLQIVNNRSLFRDIAPLVTTVK